jgi:hypothetical protein
VPFSTIRSSCTRMDGSSVKSSGDTGIRTLRERGCSAGDGHRPGRCRRRPDRGPRPLPPARFRRSLPNRAALASI